MPHPTRLLLLWLHRVPGFSAFTGALLKCYHRIITECTQSPRRTSAIAGILASAILLSSISANTSDTASDGTYIAFIGRYASPDFDPLHVESLSRLLSDPIAGQDVSLRVFRLSELANLDLQPNVSRDVYLTLTNDPNCLAIIDNSWGENISTAADIIRNSTIPVISLNADPRDADFGSNAIFLGHDEYLAEYTDPMLSEFFSDRCVAFVGEANYGIVANQFRQMATAGTTTTGSLSSTYFFEVPDATVTDTAYRELLGELKQWLADCKAQQKAPLLILHVHYRWGRSLLAWYSRTVGANYCSNRVIAISGEPALSNRDATDLSWQAGNGMLLVTTSSTAIGPEALLILEDIARDLGPWVLLRRNAGLFVQRCAKAIGMLRQFVPTSQSSTSGSVTPKILIDLGLSPPPDPASSRSPRTSATAETRAKILIAFERLREQTLLIDGEPHVFDQSLKLRREIRFDILDTDGSRSYQRQFDTSLTEVPAFTVSSQVLSISNIDLTSQTFDADLIVTVTALPEAWPTIDLSSAALLRVGNSASDRTRIEVMRLVDGPDRRGGQFRVSGAFRSAFDARKFPFDTHRLAVQLYLEFPGNNGHVVSLERSLLGRSDASPDRSSLVSSGWLVQRDPGGINRTRPRSVSGGQYSEDGVTDLVTINFIATRQRTLPLAAIVVPLTGIALCSVCFLWLKDLSLEHVGEVSAAIFIGFIAYVVFYSSISPTSQTMTIADYMFFATLLLAMGQLGAILLGNVVYGSRKMQNADILLSVGMARATVLAAIIVTCVGLAAEIMLRT